MERIVRLIGIALIALTAVFGAFGPAATPASAQTGGVVIQDPDTGNTDVLCGRSYIPIRPGTTEELPVRYWAELNCFGTNNTQLSVGQWFINTPTSEDPAKQAFEVYIQVPAGTYTWRGINADAWRTSDGVLVIPRGNGNTFTFTQTTEIVIVSDAGIGSGFYFEGTATAPVPSLPCPVAGTEPGTRILSIGTADWRCVVQQTWTDTNNRYERIWQPGLMPEGMQRPPFQVKWNPDLVGAFLLNSQRGFFLKDTDNNGVWWNEVPQFPIGNGNNVTLTTGTHHYVGYPQNGGFEFKRQSPLTPNPTTCAPNCRLFLPILTVSPPPPSACVTAKPRFGFSGNSNQLPGAWYSQGETYPVVPHNQWSLWFWSAQPTATDVRNVWSVQYRPMQGPVVNIGEFYGQNAQPMQRPVVGRALAGIYSITWIVRSTTAGDTTCGTYDVKVDDDDPGLPLGK